MITLASDADGVEAAESCAAALRAALAPCEVEVGAQVEWMVSPDVVYAVRAEELFAPALASVDGAGHDVVQRAHRLRRDVRVGVGDRTIVARNSSPARELGWLAFAATLWSAQRGDAPPFAPFVEIYRLGYVPTAIDASGVTLTAVPPSRD
jgi:hypothetical protein